MAHAESFISMNMKKFGHAVRDFRNFIHLNQQIIASSELEQALALINKALQSPEVNTDTGKGLAEIVSRYTQTFLWLQRYNEGLLDEPSGENGGKLVSHHEARQALNELKV